MTRLAAPVADLLLFLTLGAVTADVTLATAVVAIPQGSIVSTVRRLSDKPGSGVNSPLGRATVGAVAGLESVCQRDPKQQQGYSPGLRTPAAASFLIPGG